MKIKIKKVIKWVRNLLFLPFLFFSVIQFLLRNILFGFENACNYLRTLSSKCIITILRLGGALIGDNCDIHSGIIFHNCKNFNNLIIGDNCHIGKDCLFDLRDRIIIGSNVVISMRSTIITHVDITKSELSAIFPAKSEPVKICDDAYIGCGSTILMGSVIGKRSIVAAASLVKESVADNTLVAGVPARRVSNV